MDFVGAPTRGSEQRRLIMNARMLNNYWFYAIVSLLVTVVYYSLGCAFYVSYEGWAFTKTIYFLTGTIATLGNGDVVPSNQVSRLVTVLFIFVGVGVMAAVFSEMVYQIFVVHRDRALKEVVDEALPDEKGKNSIIRLLDRQISLKIWATLWMGVEVLLLVFVGVGLIYTVEDWAFADSVYWAVQTLFTIGYGDMVPASVAGRWVTVVYILSSTFIVINVVANFATLPAMFHRRTTDELILSQFDPSMRSDDAPGNPAAALAKRLKAHRMAFSGSRTSSTVHPKRASGEEEPLVAGHATGNHTEGNVADEVVAMFGPAMSAASDGNLAYLQHLAASSASGEVTRDEFALWLLFLLGRIDATDIKVVRETFDKFKAATSAGGAGVKFRNVALVPTDGSEKAALGP